MIIIDALLSNHTHGHISVYRRAKAYVLQLPVDTGCRLETLARWLKGT